MYVVKGEVATPEFRKKNGLLEIELEVFFKESCFIIGPL